MPTNYTTLESIAKRANLCIRVVRKIAFSQRGRLMQASANGAPQWNIPLLTALAKAHTA